MPAPLVPELYVSDLQRSLSFYCDLLEFDLVYDRPEEKFAYLERGGAEIMLEEPVGRVWLAAALESPFGRGVSLQIAVNDAHSLHDRCIGAQAHIFLPLETRTYRRMDEQIAMQQFVVQDPDGYLLRFAQRIEPHLGG